MAQLTRKQIRKRVLGATGESDRSSFYGSLVNDWIDDALVAIYEDTDGVEDTWISQTVVGQRDYPCPPGFLQAKLVLYQGDPLVENRLILQDYFDQGTTYPSWFKLWGWPTPSLLLGPLPPSAAVELRVFYYRSPLPLIDDDAIPPLPDIYHPYLADYATAMLKLADGKMDQAGFYMRKFEAGRTSFRQFLENNGRSNYLTEINDAGY